MLFYYALAVLGLSQLRGTVKCLFISLLGYFVVVSGIPSVTGRYRAPIMPFVCILAGIAIAKRLSRHVDGHAVVADA